MKRNTLTLVALVVILLVVAYLVMHKPGEQSLSGPGTPLLHIDSVAVDKLEIRSPKSTVVLAKQGTDWYLKEPIDYKAEQTSIGTLIHDLKNLSVKNVISDKPEKFPVFQVDTASGTHVAIYQNGKKTDSLLVGKMGSTYTEMYVRRLPSNNVDAVDGSLQYQINRQPKEWRDKTIIKVPKESIKEIKYQYGDTTFTLALQDSVWKIGNNVVQMGDVNGILGWLSNFQADDFIDSTLHPAPRLTCLISFNDNQLRFARLTKLNKYAVQASSSPQWFVVEDWKASSILKRRNDLVKPAK